MSGRKQLIELDTPERAAGTAPSVSGEYRIQAPQGSSAGRELGELELDFETERDAPLELECMPSSHRARHDAPLPMLPPALLHDAAGEPPSSLLGPSSSRAIDPRAALVAFAGFGDPPATLWGTPAYAMRVLERRRALRIALLRARSLRSQDVGLYEAAIGAADLDAVRKGIALGVAVVAVGVVLLVQIATGGLDLLW